jgi:hypothetical protein
MNRRILNLCLSLVALLAFCGTSHAQSPSAFPYAKAAPNDTSVGTTQFTLTKLNSSGNAVIMASTDTVGYSGVCISNCGKAGTAWIAFAGIVPVMVENTTTTGHYVQIGSTTGGNGHDTGATTYPSSGGDVIGKVQTGAAAAGIAMVDLDPESVASSGGTTLTGDSIAAPRACVAASASGTAYTCTTSPTFVPAAHDEILFKADVANTGAASLNVNSSSAAGLKKQGGGTALVANDFLASQWTILIFDGTSWQMQGQTGNASGGGSSSWSGLTAPSANLDLSMGSDLSEFDTTTAAANFFSFRNTTAAVVGTSQGSPTIETCGTGFHGSASVTECLGLSILPGNGNDAAIGANIGQIGTSTGPFTLNVGNTGAPATILGPSGNQLTVGCLAFGCVTAFGGQSGTTQTLIHGGVYYDTNTVASGSATPAFDLRTAFNQTMILTANATGPTFTNPIAGQHFMLQLCQNATGSFTFTFPASFKGAGTIGSTASECSTQEFFYNGTNYYATGSMVTNE